MIKIEIIERDIGINSRSSLVSRIIVWPIMFVWYVTCMLARITWALIMGVREGMIIEKRQQALHAKLDELSTAVDDANSDGEREELQLEIDKIYLKLEKLEQKL